MIKFSAFQLACLMACCWGFGGFCGEMLVLIRYGGTRRIERGLAALDRADKP